MLAVVDEPLRELTYTTVGQCVNKAEETLDFTVNLTGLLVAAGRARLLRFTTQERADNRQVLDGAGDVSLLVLAVILAIVLTVILAVVLAIILASVFTLVLVGVLAGILTSILTSILALVLVGVLAFVLLLLVCIRIRSRTI